MGCAIYRVYRFGEEIEAGYLVEALCDKDDCFTMTSRGIGQLCGRMPGGDEFGCGGYFCDEHLYVPDLEVELYQCERCLPE